MSKKIIICAVLVFFALSMNVAFSGLLDTARIIMPAFVRARKAKRRTITSSPRMRKIEPISISNHNFRIKAPASDR